MRHAVLRICGMQTGHVNQIGHNGRAGRLGTGACAVVQSRTDRVAFDHHCVHHAVDIGDQLVLGNQSRMHAQLDAFRRALGHAEQFDAVAEFFSVADVAGSQFADAFDRRGFEIDRYTKSQ